MADWMPGAEQDRCTGGAMEGQPWRSVVWHTSESGHDQSSIYGVASWVKQQGSEYHLLWNPYHGQFLQLIPASQSARALRNGSGGYRTNRKGTRLIQVCVVGRTADQPLAGGSPLHGWDRLRSWLHDDQAIPVVDMTGGRDTGRWQTSGIHRHADAPGNDHTDPGPIDMGLLYGNPPAPPDSNPDDEGEDMFIIRKKGGSALLIIGGTREHVIHDAADIEEMAVDGVPVFDLTDKTFESIRKGRT